MLKKDKERERWEQIDFQYMTEESDSDSVIHQHKLTWRSEGVAIQIHFIVMLDSVKFLSSSE